MKIFIQAILISLGLGVSTLFAETFPNTDMLGGDYKSQNMQSSQVCNQACKIESPRCKAWTFYQGRCYLKNRTPRKTYKESCVSGVPSMSFDEIKRIIAARGRYLKFKPNSRYLGEMGSLNLTDIIAAIKANPNAKIIVRIKRKTGNLAKRRVRQLNSYLAGGGLSPSNYNVKRVAGKKKNRTPGPWLSDNNHLKMKLVRK